MGPKHPYLKFSQRFQYTVKAKNQNSECWLRQRLTLQVWSQDQHHHHQLVKVWMFRCHPRYRELDTMGWDPQPCYVNRSPGNVAMCQDWEALRYMDSGQGGEVGFRREKRALLWIPSQSVSLHLATRWRRRSQDCRVSGVGTELCSKMGMVDWSNKISWMLRGIQINIRPGKGT